MGIILKNMCKSKLKVDDDDQDKTNNNIKTYEANVHKSLASNEKVLVLIVILQLNKKYVMEII